MFKTMTGVLTPNANPSQTDIQKIPSYIFCRWLSGNRTTIQAANMLNLYSDIPMENQYYMIKNAFTGKIKYIPYPKNISEEQPKHIEYLSKHFNVSMEKAKEYVDLISKEELKQIIDMYTAYEQRK